MPNLKIVSYNLHMGLETEAIIKNVRNFAAQGAAVFCFQEFWKWMQPKDLESLLLDALGPDWQMEYETTEKPGHDFGTCILWNRSVLEAVSFKRLPLPKIPKARLWEKIFIRSHGFGPEADIVQRGALVGTFDWNDYKLRIATLHLDWAGGPKQRIRQIAYIRDYLNSQPDADHEIICGDFNTIGVFNKAKQTKRLIEALGDGFIDACRNPSVTCPPFVLDHVFIKNLRAVEFQTHKLPGSDHYPVLAALAI